MTLCSFDFDLLLLFLDLDTEAVQEIAGVYNAVSFTYGNQHTDQKNADTESSFCPSFPVPEHLVQNLVSRLFFLLLTLYIFFIVKS